MEVYESDRRHSRRIQFKTALRLRVWKSGSAEPRLESENLSEHGTFFASDSLDEGMFDVVFLDSHMPFPNGINLARQMRSSRFNR